MNIMIIKSMTHTFFILNGSILDKIFLRYSALMFQDFDRVNQVNPLSQTEYVQESQTNILWGGRFFKMPDYLSLTS